MPAQGNALGLRPHRSKALKGRSPVAPLQTIISLTLVLDPRLVTALLHEARKLFGEFKIPLPASNEFKLPPLPKELNENNQSVPRSGLSLVPALHLILMLVTYFSVAVHALADTQKESRRCFVTIESASEKRSDCAPAIKEIWRIGREAEDISALQEGLKAVGEVRVVKLKTYSVVFVKAGQGDTKAMEQVIHIDSFTGTPDGLLYRIARESGADWGHGRGFSVPSPATEMPDIYTRITVTDFRGSIRQLLAETIPPSYGSMAMHVHCYPDGAIEVRQPGFLQIMERQFRADHVIGALPKPVTLRNPVRVFPEPKEKEGAEIDINKRPGESDAEYRARPDKDMLQKTPPK